MVIEPQFPNIQSEDNNNTERMREKTTERFSYLKVK